MAKDLENRAFEGTLARKYRRQVKSPLVFILTSEISAFVTGRQLEHEGLAVHAGLKPDAAALLSPWRARTTATPFPWQLAKGKTYRGVSTSGIYLHDMAQ
jgi:hypothetical protein